MAKNELIMTQMVKQKLGLDKTEEKRDTNNMNTIKDSEAEVAKALKKSQTFTPTVKAYAVVEISEKKYDIMTVFVDVASEKTNIEYAGKNFDSEARAIMEKQHMEAQDLVAKRKEEMKQHRELLKKLKEEGQNA